MGFNLTKDEGKNKFNLTKSGSKKFRIGLGWKVGEKFDLDASALGLKHVDGKPGFYNDISHAVCYGNEELFCYAPGDVKKEKTMFFTADGSIKHYGDNRTGVGDGDDEIIDVDPSKLPAEIVEIAIFITIHKAVDRGQDFSMVEDSFVRILNSESGEELCQYKLRESFAGKTAVQVGSLIRENGDWVFSVVGAGSNASLGDILNSYQ
jgi:tellurium resistance protein TerD